MLVSVAAVLALVLPALGQADIPIYPLTTVNGYFSDPYHVPYQNSQTVYISGTTHAYLECDGSLKPRCASTNLTKYETSQTLNQTATNYGTYICGAAGIHPFQSGHDDTRSWDAVVTLHVQKIKSLPCKGISGWSVIVHAHPEDAAAVNTPPKSWIGDEVLVGSFSDDVDANYDGKYFQTPAGQLYLVYQKQKSPDPKRDGVVAWPMDNPTTLKPGSNPNWLLLPNENMN